jgi:hypothetical protein
MLTGLQRRYVASDLKGNYYIRKLPTMLQKGVSGDSEDDSNDEGLSDVSHSLCESALMISSLILLQNSNGLTKVDSELARLRGLLEKKYSNDHDSGYTYIDPISSESIPLTPFMMKEWARALV